MSREDEFLKQLKEKLEENYMKSTKVQEMLNLDKWDPEKFNWKDFSRDLVVFCKEYMDIWWDNKKFNWKLASEDLCDTCQHLIEFWWDPERFDWETCSWLLCCNLNHKFNIWWNPDKFNWKHAAKYLSYYCLKYIDIWYSDYLDRYDDLTEPNIELIDRFIKEVDIDKFKKVKLLLNLHKN